MTENEKIELFDKWYDENYDEWAEGEEGIALREELEQAFKGGIADLEKENAELKETVIKMNNVITETFSKLTNAKELLKRYVPYRQITDSKAYKDLAEETEQFLNSEVEK